MKHTVYAFAFLFASVTASTAQVTDTVSIGAGYANQVWYSLANDNQGSAPKNNWDLAFDATPFGASILANTITGTTVWLYAAGDTADFATLDTAGLSAWPNYYNSDTSWSLGALNQGATSQFDMGWGIYSSITHYVTGDSLYVVKLADNTYRKLWIQLLANGAYTFRYAGLDNSGDNTVVLDKVNYPGKNFAYYSLQNNAALDREPVKSDWDLLFTQYTAFIPSPYTVSGVLANNGTTIAQAIPVDVTTAQWTSYTFITPINEIGYDWKTLNMSTFQYDITDSLVYFVQVQNGDVWKMIFTGFGGSATGNYIFTKELISPTGIAEEETTLFLGLYPNPANDNTTLTFNGGESTRITVTDLSGKTVYDAQQNATGLQQVTLSTQNWPAGICVIALQVDGQTQFRKLVVQ